MAAKRGKSLSELFIEAIMEMIREDTGYKKARERQLRLLKAGLNLGTKGHLLTSREELHT